MFHYCAADANSSPECAVEQGQRSSPRLRKCASWSMTSSVQGHPLATSTPAHPVKTTPSRTPHDAQTKPVPPDGREPRLAPNPSDKGLVWSASGSPPETRVAASAAAPGSRQEGDRAAQGVGLGAGDGVDPNVLIGEDDFGEFCLEK